MCSMLFLVLAILGEFHVDDALSSRGIAGLPALRNPRFGPRRAEKKSEHVQRDPDYHDHHEKVQDFQQHLGFRGRASRAGSMKTRAKTLQKVLDDLSRGFLLILEYHDFPPVSLDHLHDTVVPGHLNGLNPGLYPL